MKPNIFIQLKKRDSNLLTLFVNKKNPEVLNVAKQAPAPSKNYYQLLVNNTTVMLRWWEISRRGTSESRYPGQAVASYDEFIYDDLMQREYSFLFLVKAHVVINHYIEIRWKHGSQ